MQTTNIIRNLRDSRLVLRDGTDPSPQQLVVPIVAGSLSWTEWTESIEVKDRGSIAAGHLRLGDEHAVTLSFSAQWSQLIGKAADAGEPLQLYEFLTFAGGANLVSTSSPGEQQTLTLEFIIADPTAQRSERIRFENVYRETLSLLEGDPLNQIQFTGKSFATSPIVNRL